MAAKKRLSEAELSHRLILHSILPLFLMVWPYYD